MSPEDDCLLLHNIWEKRLESVRTRLRPDFELAAGDISSKGSSARVSIRFKRTGQTVAQETFRFEDGILSYNLPDEYINDKVLED